MSLCLMLLGVLGLRVEMVETVWSSGVFSLVCPVWGVRARPLSELVDWWARAWVLAPRLFSGELNWAGWED